jgi:hypothetical protein
MNQPTNKGGNRPGAGRPRTYIDPVFLYFQAERGDKEKVKEMYGAKLNRMFDAWIKSILTNKTN